MNRIDQYKSNLGKSEKEFLEEYLPSINELIEELNRRSLLIRNHSNEKIERLQRFIRSSNAPVTLQNSFYDNIFVIEADKRDEKIKKLKELGFDVNKIGEQFGSLICHCYQVTAERLKLHFVTLIDFNSLGIRNADRKPLGNHLNKLKTEFPNNKFINYFGTKIRNAITHYSYYFHNGELYLCDGYFDTSPSKMSLADFMMESKRLNILTEGFLLHLLDKYTGEGTLTLES